MIMKDTLSFVISLNVIFIQKPNLVIKCHMREKESRRYIGEYSYVCNELGDDVNGPKTLTPIKSINIYREYKRKYLNTRRTQQCRYRYIS